MTSSIAAFEAAIRVKSMHHEHEFIQP